MDLENDLEQRPAARQEILRSVDVREDVIGNNGFGRAVLGTHGFGRAGVEELVDGFNSGGTRELRDIGGRLDAECTHAVRLEAAQQAAVVAYVELRALLVARGVSLTAREDRGDDFDPPHGSLGALFPITRGMLQAADLSEDLLTGDIVSADGRGNLVEAIADFEDGSTEARLLDILCCEGCIMGAGMTGDTPLFSRRSRVSRYVRQRLATLDTQRWASDVRAMDDLDLSREYLPNDQRIPVPFHEELAMIMAGMGKFPAVMWTSSSGPVAMAVRFNCCSTVPALTSSNRLAVPRSCSSRASKFRGVRCAKKLSRPLASVSREKPVAAGPSCSTSLRKS
jgi:hypothetical protein